MAGSMKEFTDGNWKSEVARFSDSSGRRFLGTLVPALQDDRTHDRKAGR